MDLLPSRSRPAPAVGSAESPSRPVRRFPHLSRYEWGIVLCTLGLFGPMFVAMFSLWSIPEAPQSYGLVVLPAAVAMAWMLRTRVCDVRFRASAMGAPLIAAGLGLHLLGTYEASLTLSCLGFLLFSVGIVAVRYGLQVVRRLWFPFALLLAMVPLPPVVLDAMTIGLQRVSIGWASVLVQPFADSRVEGTLLHVGDYVVYVAAPCSGLTIVLPLLLVATYYLHLIHAPLWKKAALVGFTFPLAMAVNAVRVALIGLVGESYGHAVATRFHDYSGLITLFAGAMCFFLVAYEMKCDTFIGEVTRTQAAGDKDVAAVDLHLQPAVPALRRDRILLALLAGCLPIVFWATRTSPGYVLAIPPPPPLPIDLHGWHGTPLPDDPVTQRALPRARVTCMRYAQTGVPSTEVIVVSSYDRNDLHAPEDCLTDKGCQILRDEPFPLVVPGADGGRWDFHRIHLRDGQADLLLLYGYDNLLSISRGALFSRLLAKLSGNRRAPAYLVRFTAPTEGDVPATDMRLRAFAVGLMRARRSWEIPSGAE